MQQFVSKPNPTTAAYCPECEAEKTLVEIRLHDGGDCRTCGTTTWLSPGALQKLMRKSAADPPTDDARDFVDIEIE